MRERERSSYSAPSRFRAPQETPRQHVLSPYRNIKSILHRHSELEREHNAELASSLRDASLTPQGSTVAVREVRINVKCSGKQKHNRHTCTMHR